MAERALITLAQDAEDASSGLRVFRDSLPRNATQITGVIGEFFAISASLRQLDSAEGDPRFQPSFYRIREDIGLLCRSLQTTVGDVFAMFARSRDRSRQMVWEDLQHKMDQDEGEGLLERLRCYRGVLLALFDVVVGRRPSSLVELRRQLANLAAAQGVPSSSSGQSTPRPPAARPQSRIHDILTSPVTESVDWNYERPPPFAPDPPLQSPTFTSSSSTTLRSSQTSYSNEHALSGPTVHWAQHIFTGTNPVTPFRHCIEDQSECYGFIDLTSIPRTAQDGFVLALELPFDSERLWLRVYWRPTDDRTRVLIMTKASNGLDRHYCVPLLSLKIIRHQTCLKLCRARQDGRYDLWAKLNFATYERMVLVYCTLAAMKRQDHRGVSHPMLLDAFELSTRDGLGERECFAGAIEHGDMRHALRLFRDRASGGVRLEASAKRGPMQDVPIWTAFVTKYADDRDWPQYEGRGMISLAAVRPAPYVFLPRYEPARNRAGEYVLQFTTSEGRSWAPLSCCGFADFYADGKQFVEVWAALCRG
ncbi:hypothetical protein LTR91_013318 [Friedmanniomyces endolithicus]|uniref:Uncharacterized protein n=1 Tax=Friedmanniomyces endolithicus TaxID=329885 RepID=A0AAN6QPT3_9PEZI|nr:hypothetical protein LTR91_013318 [Friedmanniomyces endolithicus]